MKLAQVGHLGVDVQAAAHDTVFATVSMKSGLSIWDTTAFGKPPRRLQSVAHPVVRFTSAAFWPCVHPPAMALVALDSDAELHEFAWFNDGDSWQHHSHRHLFEGNGYVNFRGLAFSDDGEYMALSAMSVSSGYPWLLIFNTVNKNRREMSSQNWQVQHRVLLCSSEIARPPRIRFVAGTRDVVFVCNFIVCTVSAVTGEVTTRVPLPFKCGRSHLVEMPWAGMWTAICEREGSGFYMNAYMNASSAPFPYLMDFTTKLMSGFVDTKDSAYVPGLGTVVVQNYRDSYLDLDWSWLGLIEDEFSSTSASRLAWVTAVAHASAIRRC